MKAFAVIVSLLGLGLGVFCVFQGRKIEEQKAQTATYRLQAEESAGQVQRLEVAKKQLEEQRVELLQQAEDLAARLQTQAAVRPAVTAKVGETPAAAKAALAMSKADAEKGGLGGFLKSMMSDPDTKKFIEQQQRMMADQLYAPLAKKLGLTPDEATQFKNLIADNMVKSAEKATAMFGGDGGTNRAEAASQIAAEQKTFDEQMKTFLGDSRYAEYKDYQQTMGERAQLSLFKQQSMASEYPITDQQTEQLLGFIREEKQNLAAAGQPVPGGNGDKANMQALLAQDGTDKLLAAQETLNQRVYDRATTILSPDQMQTFARFQTNQMQMMRMGFSMARKMLAPEKPAGDAAAPAQ